MITLFQKKPKIRLEFLLIGGLLLVAALAHGINMLHYPYFESDEGTYLSQAWSVIVSGKLAPYTYWYDHAPVGWFFTALWLLLTGGLFTFGFSLNSGRVFMLILHVLSTLLLYLFARKITGSKLPGFIAGLLFSLSPLAIYFQRRLLLDNLMMFWLFVALCAVVYSRKKLRFIHISALATGLAILSKESAIFFLPIIVYLVYIYADRKSRIFAIASWIGITLSIIAIYILYSLVKGELFPTGTILGGTNEHVSLLGTLNYQNSRGRIPIWDATSSFWSMLSRWKGDDPFIIWTGISATFLSLLFGIKKTSGRIVGILSASYWLFLLRGGIVLDFYIIPLIPFLALTIGYVVWQIIDFLKSFLLRLHLQTFAYLLLLPFIYFATINLYNHSTHFRINQNIYTSDQTTAQKNAVNWILAKKEPNIFYAIDNYAYLDLHYRNNQNFANAEYYWKVDGDKDIRNKLLHNDASKIDYILFTPTIGQDLGTGELRLVGQAMDQSSPITSFTGDGWYVQIWGEKNTKRILTSSWDSYKRNFILGDHVIDPQRDNITTSEGQSYALLRSLWMGDKTNFDKILNWTNRNIKQDTNLLAWKWNNGSVLDKNTASDADSDTALALLFAYKKWNNIAYLQEAKKIVNGIWQHEVVQIDGTPYITAGNWANQNETITINPSYLSPANYRIFANIDTSHPWKKVVDSSYDVLNKCTNAPLDKATGVLPPEWCVISKSTKVISESTQLDLKSTEYSYNALRVPFRIGLDYMWFHSASAKQYLTSLSFLGNEWNNNKKLITAYTHDGQPWENYESVTAYAGALGYFSVVNPKAAQEIYNQKILPKFFEGKDVSYWEDPKNYYEQNWGWFGTGLYANLLPNLWDSKTTTVALK